MSELILKPLPAMEAVPAAQWNALIGDDHPFLRHEFLHALEASGAASPATGWVPKHLTLWQGEALVGVMPHYHKYHSYGEYVFDWAWADAWERVGGRYYPKGLTAIPFSPVPGPRLALAEGVDLLAARELLAQAWENAGLSSWHLLYASDEEVDAWLQVRPDLLVRHGVQFQWRDQGYGDFEGFLATLTSKRRKSIRRERRRVAEQGLTLHRLQAEAIGERELEHFFRCYEITYLERGRHGYLNLDFFRRLRLTMPEALLLIQVRLDGAPVAAALCLQGSRTLYGRYWGSEVLADCLHFEACYYQGVEHCLATGLTCFDPGTQGEHKLMRGFAPRRLRSLHHIADRGLHDAVARFCSEERAHVDAYCLAAEGALPFKERALWK
ncbi:GNAT family N-acetyltransferase [Billgrantia kenyensis]|uniref:GNAT family N-acetyltransferase n=1 Tax=Billgrantia kenyensis TaxID=321266 RepID=A0A7V9VZR1_9GAMM|nr:GNAT family N-acetyltransferase [Halomonas kenyensis]MBA2778399.1 GNAT family N-acetyltransferase [Halomonas kenyensis]MCG6660705.1 GNAT family N-acetyltransferase [Halomonas kenyensis]